MGPSNNLLDSAKFCQVLLSSADVCATSQLGAGELGLFGGHESEDIRTFYIQKAHSL